MGNFRVCALAAFLALIPLTGCEWLQKQNIDICVDYKGRHVCVGRKDGAWTFSADLSKEEQNEIIAGLGQ